MPAWKKQLILWSSLLALAAIAVLFLPRLELLRTGYVLIGLGRWEIELTAVALALILGLSFVLLYAAVRLTGLLLSLPAQQRRKKTEAGFRQLMEGLRQAAEGNWHRAEQILIQGAALSDQALVHYLTAARLAHQRGAEAERDVYLRQAYEAAPNADLAVKLTEAELKLAGGKFDQALESLLQLEKIAPGNARILKLLHEAYAKLGDFEGLSRLLPQLREHKVLLEAEIRLLELETYSALLKEAVAGKDPEALAAKWQELPEHARDLPDLQTIYFAAMIECGGGANIAESLCQAIERHWQAPLLVLYGGLELGDAEAQLRRAEKWLALHPEDAVLHQVLGKLAGRAGLDGQAEEYLRRSLTLKPSVEAYRLLGDLLYKQGALKEAADCYRRGLMLASKAVIEEIEAHPEG
ncbi:MAG: heme biosynthesis protein HemY [Methylohalobius sp.]|nr:heme biosynthesis protein HemY [Methylohalobius sp.]